MSENIIVPTMAEMLAQGKQPEVLFWVGCAGSFDDRAKKITKAFVRILNRANISFAVLGTEESCTGDPAKRAGNEFLFQMQAMMNIEVLNAYEAKKIVTACPHCFNTLKNEYPELGGVYEVVHHTEFLKSLLDDGRLTDAQGNTVSFENTIIIMTSNAGSNLNTNSIGFGGTQVNKSKVLDTLKETFRPEFLNRVDEIVVFEQLNNEQLMEIINLMLQDTKKALSDKDITMELTDAAIKFLLK